MADRDSERDRRVRELMSDASKKKDQLAVLGQSQAEIQDIQSELQNHLAMQQAQDAGRLQETGIMSQAAGMMMASQGDQLQGQVAAMNPGTQAMMGKYGVKPKKSQSSSHNQNQSRVISKSGDITNIKNETITNNHTDIRVTQPSIPMSQPVISVAGTQKKEDGTAKFKAWLSGMFAKQQNDAEIQKKEYRKKEWNLGRTTTRLMKRIENATASLGAKLDPKNMTSTLGGQIKWLLLIFGATMMAKFWKPTMKFLANLEGGFRTVFGLPMNNDLRNASSGTLSVIDQIKEFIGIKKGENESLIGGIGKVFMEGIDKLIDKLKFWFEDRASALKEVEFPELKVSPIGIPGFDGLLDGLTGAFKGVAQYLGDIITVAMGGSKGKVKVEANKIARQAKEVFTDTKGKKVSVGDEALIKGAGRDYMRDSDYDMFGNLKSGASSTQAMSQSLISMFNDKTGKAHTAEIGTGVSQLFNVAKRNGQVVINPELLQYLVGTADVTALQRNKQLYQKQYRIIAVHPTDQDLKEGNNYTAWNQIGAGLTGAAAGAYLGMKGGAAAGGSIGGLFGGVGAAPGAIIGGGIGALTGGAVGYWAGSGVGAGVDATINNWKKKGLIPKIVPADSNQMGEDGSRGIPKMMWVLTKEGADQVAAKFTSEMNNHDMDLTNKEFYDKIRKIEEQKKRQNGVRGVLTQNLPTNDLNVAQAQYDAYNKQWYENFESNDPNSKNMQTYGHYNAFSDHVSGVFNNIGSSISNGVRAVGNFVTSERLSGKQATSRSNYLIQALMQKSGLTKEQAAGVAGNIMRESGFVTNKWGDNHTSVGIAQWHEDRINRYNKEYGAQGHLADASFEQQVDYLIWEAEKYGVMDKMRQTRSSAEAANTWERLFEKSQDYAKNGNRYRIEYSAKALNSFNDSSGSVDMSALQSQNASMATYYKGESPFKLEGGTSAVGGGNVIAWIGDSHSEFGLPGVVGNRLKSKFGCQYVWGAYRGYSAHSHLKNKPYHGVCSKDNKVNNFSEILNKKPGIIIVELGANDANGVDGDWKTGIPKLIDTIKGNGTKVVWLTPLGYSVGAKNARKNAIDMNKSANQVREYILSRSDISVVDVGGFVNFYSCQATPWDKFVGNDGLHWNSTGYKMLGEWIGGVLTGVVSNPGFTSEDLEKQDGIFGAVSENVGEFITNLADKIDGEKTGSQVSPLENIKLTEEQQRVVAGYQKFVATNNNLNAKSLERLGAKTDTTGTYFEIEGGYRGYIDPNSTSGMLGIDSSDIQFVAKLDRNGKLTSSGIEHDEIEAIKNSVAISVGSLATNYEGKNSGSRDFMLDGSGKKIFFPLGTFSDLNFKEPAMADFADIGGKISYFIYPSKDRARTTMVGIAPGYKIAPQKIKSTHVIYNNWAKEGLGKENSEAIVRYYGPIIYHKGAKWIKWGHLESDKVYTEYQPLAEYQRVWLTPQALKARVELFNLLSLGKLTKDSFGNLMSESGEKLTQEQLKKAAKYGILSSTAHSNGADGADGVYFTYNTKENVNQAQESASSLLRDSTINGIKNYLSDLGISDKATDKDVKKFYEEHKDLFEVVDGKLLSVNGLQFGTVGKDGNITFSSYDTVVNSNRNKETLDSNLRELKSIKASRIGNIYGITDLNKAVDFISEVGNTYRNLTTEDYETMKKDRRTYTQNKFVTVPDYLEGTNGQRIPIRYNVYYNEDGSIAKVTVSQDQVTKFLTGIYGEDAKSRDIGISLSSTDSQDPVYDIKKKLVDVANKYKKNWNVHTNFLGKGRIKGPSKVKTGYSSLLDQILKDNKSNQEIRSIDYDDNLGYAYVTYEDGTKSKFGGGSFGEIFYGNDVNRDNITKQLNASIRERNTNKYNLAEQKVYQGSDLAAYYRTIADQINTGQITEGIEYKQDGSVWLNGKQIGTSKEIVEKDEKGRETKKRVVVGLSDYKIAIKNSQQDINNSPAAKIAMLKRLFGAVVEGGNLYVYSKARDANGHHLTRVLLDPTIDIRDNMKADLRTFTKKVEFWDGESWTNVKAEGGYRDMSKNSDGSWSKYAGGTGWAHGIFGTTVDQTTAYNQIISGIQNDVGIKKNVDVNTAILQEMNENLLESNELYNLQLDKETLQLIEQAKARKLQIRQVTAEEIIAANTDPTKTTDQIAEIVAKAQIKGNSEMDSVNSQLETQIAQKSKVKLRKFTYVDDAGKNQIRYYDPTKLIKQSDGSWKGQTLTGETIQTKDSFKDGKQVTIFVGGDSKTGYVNNFYHQSNSSGDASLNGSTGDD